MIHAPGAEPGYEPGSGAPAEDQVPEGTIAEVLAWVEADQSPPGRAQAAYDAEAARPAPRTTLLAQLESLGAEPPDPTQDGDA